MSESSNKLFGSLNGSPLGVEQQELIVNPGSDSSTPNLDTPVFNELRNYGRHLNAISSYKTDFDYEVYRNLERRFTQNSIRGGITSKTVFRLVNHHTSCNQCLYAFEIDTYGRGCVHNCVYCYAKAQLTVHGYWNNPIPVPIDINDVRKAFYLTFETDKNCKWRKILESRVPLRIGSMSDSFMWSDKKYGVTKELLRILKFYKYPYIVFTRSDLVAEDEYVKLLDKNIAAIQFSLSSTNELMSRQIEPGAPSPSRRLKALKKLVDAGIWTTIRLNPFFPIYPDGYFSDPQFDKSSAMTFNYSSFEMIDEIAETKVPAILAGFVRLSRYGMNSIEKVTGFDLRSFFKCSDKKSRDFHYSPGEVRAYYEQIKKRCDMNNIEFTTCYIGNGASQFWRDQDLWSNKLDCCNVKMRVNGFISDSREIPHSERLRLSNKRTDLPVPIDLHKPLGHLEAPLARTLP